MQSAVAHPLPYTLKRPFFRFFTAFSVLLVGAALLGWLLIGRGWLLLPLIFGGPLWFGFLMGVLFNWQSLSLRPDCLAFNSFGHKYAVPYQSIREVAAVLDVQQGYQGMNTLTLFLHHEGEAKSPLQVNLKLFGARERIFLMNVIAQHAPQAQLNDLARRIQAGQTTVL